MQINIEEIRELVKNQKIQWRGHMLARMRQRNIKIEDVIKCINLGEIIEYYYDDYPYPGSLILGFTNEKEYM